MSRTTALRADVAPGPDPRRPDPRPTSGRAALRLVPGRRPRLGRGAFAVLVLGLLGLGLLALLLLNTWTAQSAFVVNDLEKHAASLEQQHQALAQQVAILESPAELQSRAKALGMVASGNPVFLRLADGKVLGVPAPAGGSPTAAATPGAATAPTPAATRPRSVTPSATATPRPAVRAPEAAEQQAATDGAAPVARSGPAPGTTAAAVPPPEAAEQQAPIDAGATLVPSGTGR